MELRNGRYGPFLASVDYPNSSFVLNLDKKGNVKYPAIPPLVVDTDEELGRRQRALEALVASGRAELAPTLRAVLDEPALRDFIAAHGNHVTAFYFSFHLVTLKLQKRFHGRV